MEYWHEKKTRINRRGQAVVKIHRDGETYSCAVPSQVYPLNGDPEIFSYAAGYRITNETILDAFDSVTYSIGHCYDNTKSLVKALRDRGIDAVSYAGWLFTSAEEFPVHHCWCVVNGHVLDLSDDFSLMLSEENRKNFEGDENPVEAIVAFTAWAKTLRNRDRCCPVGIPTGFLYYVGSPCDPDEAKAAYKMLLARYPNHECIRNCDSEGLNKTQRALAKHGLFERR